MSFIDVRENNTSEERDEKNCQCGRGQKFIQTDWHGIYAGKMCDKCFQEKFKQYDYEQEERDFYEG